MATKVCKVISLCFGLCIQPVIAIRLKILHEGSDTLMDGTILIGIYDGAMHGYQS